MSSSQEVSHETNSGSGFESESMSRSDNGENISSPEEKNEADTGRNFGDFREATYRAIRQGLKKAKSLLLEPYYEFDRNAVRQQIRECFNKEISNKNNGSADINEVYQNALETVKKSIPNADKFNLTFRKNKDGNYNGLIILNRFSNGGVNTRKSSVKIEELPSIENNNKTLKLKPQLVEPRVTEPDDYDYDMDEDINPPKQTTSVRRRKGTTTVNTRMVPKNTDRKGPVRRERNTALESTVKNLASQIDRINARLVKMKMKRSDEKLMKAARKNLKSIVRSNDGYSSSREPQITDYSNVFEKIYYDAYEKGLREMNNNTSSIEDLKNEAIKYFH